MATNGASSSGSTDPRRGWRRVSASLALVVAIAASSGCATDPAVRAAEIGDLATLTKLTSLDATPGATLDAKRTRAIARATVEHEIDHAGGTNGGARLMSLTACSGSFGDALGRAAEQADADVASIAAWLLVEDHLRPVDAFTPAHRDDVHARWRAVATRGLVRPDDVRLRRARLSDDDEYVRDAAIEASAEVGDVDDARLLIERGRHDPLAALQRSAFRAVGTIAERVADPALRGDLAARLDDLWSTFEPNAAASLVAVFARRSLFDVGGHTTLLGLVRSTSPSVAASAAAALFSRGDAEGEAALARLALTGNLTAIGALDGRLPLHHDALFALLRADDRKGGKDLAQLAAADVVARDRLRIADKLLVDAAMATLRAIANGTTPSSTLAAATLLSTAPPEGRARVAHELEISPALRNRLVALLSRAGFPEDARKLLVDHDLDTRLSAACAILSAPSR